MTYWCLKFGLNQQQKKKKKKVNIKKESKKLILKRKILNHDCSSLSLQVDEASTSNICYYKQTSRNMINSHFNCASKKLNQNFSRLAKSILVAYLGNRILIWGLHRNNNSNMNFYFRKM